MNAAERSTRRQQLQAELKQLEQLDLKDKLEQRAMSLFKYIAVAGALASIVKHTQGCTDEHPYGGEECPRCFLLDVAKTGEWNPDYVPEFHLRYDPIERPK